MQALLTTLLTSLQQEVVLDKTEPKGTKRHDYTFLRGDERTFQSEGLRALALIQKMHEHLCTKPHWGKLTMAVHVGILTASTRLPSVLSIHPSKVTVCYGCY